MSLTVHADDGVAASVDRLLADAARGGGGARSRCESVVAELALPPEYRLRDDERAAIDRIAAALADEVARALGGAEAGQQRAAASAYKRDPAIVAAFLRRIDEHRIAAAWRAQDRVEPPLLDTMLAPGDPDAPLATALLIALGRRFDRFDDPILPLADLALPLRHRCTWVLAAQVPALADAVPALLDGLADVPTLEARATTLARSIGQRAPLDDGLILRAFDDGCVPFAIAALAHRAGIGMDPAWEMATGGDTLAALLRAIGMDRAIAARIMLGLAAVDRLPADDRILVARVALFDALSLDQARAVAASYARDPDYRAALGRRA